MEVIQMANKETLEQLDQEKRSYSSIPSLNLADGNISIDYKYRQNKVGCLTVDTLFFEGTPSSYRTVISLFKEIGDGKPGYGYRIFYGSLKELIDLVLREKGVSSEQ